MGDHNLTIFTPELSSFFLLFKLCLLVKTVTWFFLKTSSSDNIFIYAVIPETFGK